MPKFSFGKPSSGSIGYTDKKADTAYVLKRLWHYMGKYRLYLIAALTMTLLGNVLALCGPVLTGRAVNAMGIGPGKTDFTALGQAAALMAAAYLLSGAMAWACQLIMVIVTQRTIYSLRSDMFDKITSLPSSYFDKNKKGDIISKMSYDIDTLGTSVSSDLVQVLTSFVSVAGSFTMMIGISPLLSLIFVALLPVTLLYTKTITRRTRKLFRDRQRSIGMLNAHAEEMLTGQKTVKAYGHEDAAISRFDEINEYASDTGYRAQLYSGLVMPVLNCINNIGFLLVTVFGALLTASGRMSLGGISSFILYSKKFSGPINEAANIISDIQSAFAAGERVFLLIDEMPETANDTGTKEMADIKGDVEFRDVSFSYDKEVEIIHKFNLRVSAGQTIAIVGQTGAGKTTIVNLLMRFYDVDGGAILIDNTDIKDVTRDSLRSAIGMVLQDTWLFTGTVRDNISYGSIGATDSDIVHASKRAMAHEFIESLPDGYDTVIDDNGLNISQGQRQLITIARAMLSDPRILILDEATSNVDTRTEAAIQQAMNELMRGRTCFIIAHRLSSIVGADRIIVMQNGSIVETGSHADLMQAGGYYKELYNSQYDLTPLF